MPDKAISSAKKTLVEEGTEFKGTMTSTCPVTVNGRIEGELSAPRLDVTSTGAVVGKIKADRLTSRGQLSGEIDAGDLSLSGSVGSNTVIRAKNLEVKLSPSAGRMQVTFGECTLDVGDEPSKEVAKDVADTASASNGRASIAPEEAEDAKKTGGSLSAPPLDPGPDPKPLEAADKSDSVVPPPVAVGGDKSVADAKAMAGGGPGKSADAKSGKGGKYGGGKDAKSGL